jgi:capsular polysaccharide transport system permease protein
MTDVRTRVAHAAPRQSLAECFRTQRRVMAAIIMRELHTRYGRENIGYLWVIIEPLIYGAAVAAIHGIKEGTAQHNGISPVASGVIGYSIFIIWRGIIGRADGAMNANLPLLHHKMVTTFDICFSRNLLELTGCLCAFSVLMSLCCALGMMDPPARPLYLMLGIGYVFWLSTGLGFVITGLAYERPIVERLIHPATYFSMPLSGAFYTLGSLPESVRYYVSWFPLPHMFEIVRYGAYSASTLDYVDFSYITICCMVMTLLGLISLSIVKDRLHAS